MFLANMPDEGLTILPTHRLVKDLPEDALDQLSADFDIEKMNMSDNISAAIAGGRMCTVSIPAEMPGIDSVTKARVSMACRRRSRIFDVTILHDLIFKQLLDIETVSYEMDCRSALQAVRSGEFRAGFF